jgi:hypothetical protein
VRILGEHNRGKLYNPVPDKKDTYFLGIRKKLSTPPMISGILRNVWAMIKRCVGDCVGENEVGRCF